MADPEEGWTLTHGFFSLMGGFNVRCNDTTIRTVFYHPYAIEDDAAFARDFTSFEALEGRLAARHLKSSNRNSPAQGLGYHILQALESIQSRYDTFKVTLQRVERESGISINKCIEQVKLFKRAMNKGELCHSNVQSFQLRTISTFLEAFERYTIAVTLGNSGNTVDPTTIEYQDGTKQSIFDHIPNPSIENLRHHRVPVVNEQDIQDKSKSDMLTKTIALFQVAWFILQLYARYHENLAITELEILTLAFCIINFATYALWWKKPFAVDSGYAIRWRDDKWEVIVPPFVKTDQVPWYRWFLNWIRRDTKGIKQVLALHLS
ncbi:hypothetical protein NLI96_g12306 [Meripilus lineatus]|uniref:Uncharacterized protein n=1 Tax=Meripilus lineatus TaxID=2056292 RepID=A0AAD5Y7Q2_9APHY|nr:hypothetical protein NLI96_g12306 [Physisporinus lineatus]